MQIHQETNLAAITIRRYQQGCVDIVHPITERDEDEKPIINQQQLTRSAVIMGATLIEEWPVENIEALKAEHLEKVLSLEPEVILVGTGDKLSFPSPHCAEAILQQGVGVEYMDIGAACRTYNILTAEGRHVAVALILGGDGKST
ncbi:MAG: Mth938-like domain-containing protein [Gammaproteobacteria bacterium]|nr:Mth938-like domain-containing protein [Gammaproteobacteria bacterium]MCF6231253.1 Mth938-like domain-containing protein [Gammaproteobacteria bacterium]